MRITPICDNLRAIMPGQILLFFSGVAVAYALGCFSTSYYYVRLVAGSDIRQEESGTAGARNFRRLLGRKAGIRCCRCRHHQGDRCRLDWHIHRQQCDAFAVDHGSGSDRPHLARSAWISGRKGSRCTFRRPALAQPCYCGNSRCGQRLPLAAGPLGHPGFAGFHRSRASLCIYGWRGWLVCPPARDPLRGWSSLHIAATSAWPWQQNSGSGTIVSYRFCTAATEAEREQVHRLNHEIFVEEISATSAKPRTAAG